MFGRSIADTGLTMWGLFVAGVLAFIVGFRFDADALEVVLAIALLVLAAYSFSWIFITIGLVSNSAQARCWSASGSKFWRPVVSSAGSSARRRST